MVYKVASIMCAWNKMSRVMYGFIIYMCAYIYNTQCIYVIVYYTIYIGKGYLDLRFKAVRESLTCIYTQIHDAMPLNKS